MTTTTYKRGRMVATLTTDELPDPNAPLMKALRTRAENLLAQNRALTEENARLRAQVERLQSLVEDLTGLKRGSK